MAIPSESSTYSSSTDELDPALVELAQHLASQLGSGDPAALRALEARSPSDAEGVRRLLPALALLDELRKNWSLDEPELLSPDPGPGRLGDFRLIRPIGRGGMGTVFEAIQVSLNRRVAVKVLPAASMLDPRKLKRFEIEAKSAAQLHHTNIVPVYAVGCERGKPYYAMQLIEGRSLAEFIEDIRIREGLSPTTGSCSTDDDREHHVGRTDRFLPETREGPRQSEGNVTVAADADLTFRPATDSVNTDGGATVRDRSYFRTLATLGYQVAQALEHAHERGILHRDIKPANLLLDALGTVWVTDFGLARYRDGHDLTTSGDILGTLRFMSPEQARGTRETIDGRTDVYSLGVTLYELLTLRPAFDGRDREELLYEILNTEPIAPSRISRSVPADLETIVLKALSKQPDDRYASAQLMADDLRRFLDDKPILARRPGLLERLARRARRNVALLLVIASMLAVSLATLSIVVGMYSAWLYEVNKELRQTTQRERGITQEALRQRSLAESQTKLSNRYHQASRLRLASQEWEAGQVERAQEILGDLSLGTAKAEPFGFAGQYLDMMLHRQVHLLGGHEAMPSAVASSIDRRRLATGDYDGAILVWDVLSMSRVAKLNGTHGKIAQIALSPDGRRLISATREDDEWCIFQLWDVDSSVLVGEFSSPDWIIGGLLVSADFRRLAIQKTGKTGATNVEIWRVPRDREAFEKLLDLSDVKAIAFAPWGGEFAAIEGGDRVRIHAISGGRAPRVVAEGMGELVALNFDSTGKILWAGGGDSSLISWDLSTGSTAHVLMRIAPQAGEAALIRLVPRGQPIAVFRDSTGAILVTSLRDGRTKKLKDTIPGSGHLAISDNGRWLAFGDTDYPARIWDLYSDDPPLSYFGETGDVHGLEFISDSPTLAIAGEHPSIRLWHPRPERQELLFARHAPETWAVAIAPDGSTIYSAGDDHQIRVWDVETHRERSRLHGHESLVTCLTLNSTGSILVSGSFDGTVRLWGLKGESLRLVLRGHTAEIRAIALSPDGRLLASAGSDCTIRVWDFPTGRLRFTLKEATKPLRALAISPDGKTLASGGNDGMLMLWNLETGLRTASVRGAHEILSLSYSPDGELLAASRGDGAILLCRSASLATVLTLRGHTGEVRCVAFSPDGYTLASGGKDQVVKLWDTRTGQDLLSLRGDDGLVTSLAFSLDSRSLVSADLAGAIHRWTVDAADSDPDHGFDELATKR